MEWGDDCSWCIDTATVLLKGHGLCADDVLPDRVKAAWRFAFHLLWTSHANFISHDNKVLMQNRWLNMKKTVVKDLASCTKAHLDKSAAANASDSAQKESENMSLVAALPEVDWLVFRQFVLNHSTGQAGLSFKSTYRSALGELRDSATP